MTAKRRREEVKLRREADEVRAAARAVRANGFRFRICALFFETVTAPRAHFGVSGSATAGGLAE